MNYLPHNLMVGKKLMRGAIGVEKQKSDFIFSTRGVWMSDFKEVWLVNSVL